MDSRSKMSGMTEKVHPPLPLTPPAYSIKA
jgi:hypothetical protein